MAIYKALTIAGSDSSGGAGIQADLKTFQERSVYGMSALTTIVAMDPDDNWRHDLFPVSVDTVEAQLHTVLNGIGVHALKTGMIGSRDTIELIAKQIEEHQIERVVIDPVIVCKGEGEVLQPEIVVSLREFLVPKATIVTPNLIEAALLSERSPIKTLDDMKDAAVTIKEAGAQYVLIKGGRRLEHPQAVDLLYDGETFDFIEAERLNTPYTHGAGCTHSAAITAELAKGKSVKEAVRIGKTFVTEAIRYGFPLNAFVGPTLHAAYRMYGH